MTDNVIVKRRDNDLRNETKETGYNIEMLILVF